MRKMYRLHGFEERLRLVLQVKSGCPISVLSRIHRLDHKMLLEWVRKYDRYGEAGLIDPPSRRISPEIKEEAVRLILEKSIPLPPCLLFSRGVGDLAVASCSSRSRYKSEHIKTLCKTSKTTWL